MRGTDFDEIAFFRSVQDSGARALLSGRRVLVLVGLPVLTADYDFWVAIDDISRFNDAIVPFGLQPNRIPEEARRTGRYVLENDEHVDVLVARSTPTIRAWLETPIGDAEREEVLSLVRWFTRRYATPAERLAYVRLAYSRWQRATARAASTGSC